MINRKFLAEGGLHLYSSGASVLRPADLYTFADNEQLKDALELCNIYFVVRRKRISICPQSIRIQDGQIFGDFRLHDGFYYERFPFRTKGHLGGHPLYALEAKSEDLYGHQLRVRLDSRNSVVVPAYQLPVQCQHKLGTHTDLDILYVGQGKGRKISRTAFQRLYAHVTLQRILADTLENHPDSELLLLMFRFEHHRNIISTAGEFSVEPTATQEEESRHFKHLQNAQLDRNARINLAEAALISYFKPHYNVHYRENRPSGKHKIVKGLLDLDLTALIVEVNTANIGCRLKSQAAKPMELSDLFDEEALKRLKEMREARQDADKVEEFIADMTHTHIARIPLYTAEERETFLHALPWSES